MEDELIYKRGKPIPLKNMQHITPMTSDPLKAVTGFCSDMCHEENREERLLKCDAGQDTPRSALHTSEEMPPPVVLINSKNKKKKKPMS